MNDEELPINDELASAYLDDELDAAERATASADPEVMATVESFARVRVGAQRDRACRRQRQERRAGRRARRVRRRRTAGTAAAPVATVTSLQSRRRVYRAFTGVAAAVAILAIGVAAINGGRGSGDNKRRSAVHVESAPAAPSRLPRLRH